MSSLTSHFTQEMSSLNFGLKGHDTRNCLYITRLYNIHDKLHLSQAKWLKAFEIVPKNLVTNFKSTCYTTAKNTEEGIRD